MVHSVIVIAAATVTVVFGLLVVRRDVKIGGVMLGHDEGMSTPLFADDEDLFAVMMDGVQTLSTPTETLLEESAGYADYAHRVPMLVDAHIPIGSNSKLFTTVAIYQLHERGLLDVDADIATMLDRGDFAAMGLPISYRSFCPRLAPYGLKCQTITLRQILSMSSGIYPTLNCDTDLSPSSCNDVSWLFSHGSLAAMVGTFLRNPLLFVPGTQYHYSNPNFVLAAYFVEKFSGMTFRKYLEKRIFDPIGLQNTYYDYFSGTLEMDPKLPRPYFKYYVPQHHPSDKNKSISTLLSVGMLNVHTDMGMASGSGGIVSTAKDIRQFWYSLLLNTNNKSAVLLKDPASLTSILTPYSLVSKSQAHWNNSTFDVWTYYSQGLVLACLTEDCMDFEEEEEEYGNAAARRHRPRWIWYSGLINNFGTANVLDYQYHAMSQLWTSTRIASVPSEEDFNKVVKSQTGRSNPHAQNWTDSRFENPAGNCFHKLLQRYPPPPKTTNHNIDDTGTKSSLLRLRGLSYEEEDGVHLLPSL